MKTIFLLFACTCLLSGLSALNFPLEDENFNAETFESAFENSDDDDLENFFSKNDEQNLIASYLGEPPITENPSSTPRPGPTGPPPPRPPTRPPRPTPTTRPPPPTPTTRPTPPKPTTRPPPPRPNARIYENSVRGLGPFASQLINIVLNREGGKQKTVQRNDVLYNFRSLRKNQDLDDEETQE